jgi:nitrite reductase/ring-hydroxylating ferredoxin subunit
VSESIPAEELPPGTVRELDGWAVGTRPDGTRFALGRRCRHQLADMAKGSVDRDGCLVCPWHGSRYDTETGRMVRGPKGFLGYHGPTPGYTQFVRAYATVLRLSVGRVVERGGRVTVRGRWGSGEDGQA